ncbi:MAG: glycosyltransferase family 39 protein [Acidimicrobiales bacterium]|nr:glycosyltransferase family 39 protein [Acidimicrobiales bacterium]
MRRRLRTFPARLAVVAVAALLVRFAVVLLAQRHLELGFSDNFYYHWQGRALADGLWFANPFAWRATGELVPTAGWPPAYPVFLGVVSALGGTSVLAHRLASALLGVLGVVLLGLVGRKVAGDRAGLVAAALAAVYPVLWVNDGMLLNESLYVPMLALVLLAAYEARERPDARRALVLGAIIALAALTRAEALALFGLLALPLFLLVRTLPWGRRLALVALTGAAGLAVLAPWVIYNNARFDRPVLVTNGAGFVLAIANCDRTYGGEFLGYWHIDCALEDWPEGDESVAERAGRRQGLTYARDHASRLPVVVAARVGRLWDVFRPGQGIRFDTFFERRGLWTSRAGLAMYYVLVPVAGYGLYVLHRRGVTIVPFVALLAVATLTAAVSFGITRYRVPGDVALVVLAGVGVDAFVRARSSAPADGDEPPAREPAVAGMAP